uniref:L1 transposable element RRM domain-containing protein n=1 Tax=Oryzias latipes TaxID=8090 RepID=A0A3B3HIC5_ORYLA
MLETQGTMSMRFLLGSSASLLPIPPLERQTSPPTAVGDEQEKEEAAGISAFTAVLTAKLAETKSELLAEIKDTYARYEARLSTVQAAVDDHTERIAHLEQSADSTSIDVTEMKTTLSAIAAENAKLKAKLTDLEGRSRRNNIRIFGLPENIEGPTPTVFFSQLLFEVLGADVLSSPPELDRAHRSLAAKPGPAGKPRHVVICFHRFQTRELVVRTARRLRGNLSYKGSPIHIVEDYCPEVLEQRGQYRDVMRKLYQLGHKPALRYPAKLFVVMEDGSRKHLPSVKDAADFVSRRCRDDGDRSLPESN